MPYFKTYFSKSVLILSSSLSPCLTNDFHPYKFFDQIHSSQFQYVLHIMPITNVQPTRNIIRNRNVFLLIFYTSYTPVSVCLKYRVLFLLFKDPLNWKRNTTSSLDCRWARSVAGMTGSRVKPKWLQETVTVSYRLPTISCPDLSLHLVFGDGRTPWAMTRQCDVAPHLRRCLSHGMALQCRPVLTSLPGSWHVCTMSPRTYVAVWAMERLTMSFRTYVAAWTMALLYNVSPHLRRCLIYSTAVQCRPALTSLPESWHGCEMSPRTYVAAWAMARCPGLLQRIHVTVNSIVNILYNSPFKKLLVSQLLKKFPAVSKTKGLLPFSQQAPCQANPV